MIVELRRHDADCARLTTPPIHAICAACNAGLATMTRNDAIKRGLDPRRRKLLFRSWHRGMREMDLILGGFADAAIARLDRRRTRRI